MVETVSCGAYIHGDASSALFLQHPMGAGISWRSRVITQETADKFGENMLILKRHGEHI